MAANQIDPPIEILLPGQTRKKIFRTWKSVSTFAQQEKETWAWVSEEGRPQLAQPIGSAAGHQWNTLNNLVSWSAVLEQNPAHPDPNIRNNIRNVLISYQSKSLIYARSDVGLHIQQVANWDPKVALGMMAVTMPHAWGLAGDAWRIVSRSAAILEFGDLGDVDNIERRAEALRELHNEWHARLEQQESDFSALNERLAIVERNAGKAQKRVSEFWRKQASSMKAIFSGVRKESKQLREDTLAQKDALETAFRDHMRLKAPADYWKTKSDAHGQNKYWALAAFVVLIIFGGGSFFANIGFFKDLLSNATGNLGLALLASLPAIAFFWLLRFIARLFVTNLEREQDARERETMITTYLSLLAEGEGAATDQERILILNALFRPGPGDVKDETPPTPLFEMINQITKQK